MVAALWSECAGVEMLVGAAERWCVLCWVLPSMSPRVVWEDFGQWAQTQVM